MVAAACWWSIIVIRSSSFSLHTIIASLAGAASHSIRVWRSTILGRTCPLALARPHARLPVHLTPPPHLPTLCLDPDPHPHSRPHPHLHDHLHRECQPPHGLLTEWAASCRQLEAADHCTCEAGQQAVNERLVRAEERG